MDVFGAVADLYETARPGYPPALTDAVLAYSGGRPASIAEIGAGTGKGTEVLAVVLDLRTTLALARAPHP